MGWDVSALDFQLSLVLFHYSLLVYSTKKNENLTLKKGRCRTSILQLGVKGNVAIWKRQNSFFMRVKGSSSEINQMPKNSHYHILQFWWLHKASQSIRGGRVWGRNQVSEVEKSQKKNKIKSEGSERSGKIIEMPKANGNNGSDESQPNRF